MKIFILVILLTSSIFSQPTTTAATTLLRTATLATSTATSSAAPTTATPDSNVAMDTSSSDAASVGTSSVSSIVGGASAYIYKPTTFSDANNAWNYLQRLGGGCCDNCKKICGFGIKIAGTSYYLTNMGTFYRFLLTSNPNSNQIFTLGQNADCTWSISNGGSYVSTSSIWGAPWAGPASSVGTNERWYIERTGAYVVVQSAATQYSYWRASSPNTYFLGVTANWATRLTFEYLPCDKTFGWNW